MSILLIFSSSSTVTPTGRSEANSRPTIPLFRSSGLLSEMVINRDPRFTSTFWRSLCRQIKLGSFD